VPEGQQADITVVPAGVTRALPDGAVAYARDHGAPAVDAYPIDPGGRRADTAFGYVGFLGMFVAAGFRPVIETAARSDRLPRILVRLALARGAAASGPASASAVDEA
jgi:hypothetical protein